MNYLKKKYADTVTFYRQGLGDAVFTTAWVFAAMVALSFLFSILLPDMADGLVENYLKALMANGVTDESGTISFSGLLLNNFYAMLLAMVYGILPFLYLPALTLGINASMIGLCAGYYLHNGISLWVYLVGILPHGIFEIPALILSIAMGIHLCKTLTDALRKRQKGTTGAVVSRLWKQFGLWVVPLLFAAAAMETYVTPAILGWLQ